MNKCAFSALALGISMKMTMILFYIFAKSVMMTKSIDPLFVSFFREKERLDVQKSEYKCTKNCCTLMSFKVWFVFIYETINATVFSICLNFMIQNES